MENKKVTTKKLEVVEEEKQVVNSQKRLYIVLAIIVVFVLGGLYVFKWQQVKQKEKLMKSYLISSGTVNLEIKNLDEVSYYKTEAPNSYFVLISYTGSEDTYNLENGLKTIIDKYQLNDEFYYLNVENLMKEDNYLTRLNTAFNTDKIKAVPVILYYKDGEIVDTVKRLDNNPIKAADFQRLLDIYDF